MLQTNLYDATELKAIQDRELNDSTAYNDTYSALESLFLDDNDDESFEYSDYADSDVYVNVYTDRSGQLIRSHLVRTGDAETLAEELRATYPSVYTISIEN